LYTIAHKNRNKIMKKLNSLGIGATVYYSTPIHKTPYYKTKKKLPNTEWASSHILCLPIHPKVGTSDLEKMQRVLGNKK
jgi:dTDP-4-amino-4,6-dideoxygalactose transaminase